MKIIILFLLIFVGCIGFCDEHAIYNTPSLYQEYQHYLNWHDDPSLSVYEAEQENYIEQNYGSSESMEYLNRADSDSYWGGSDFDRNY